MALQARKLHQLLRRDGIAACLFASNFPLPGPLKTLDRLPGIRTLVRAALIAPKLWWQVRKSDVVHILAASWAYFFLVVCPAVLIGRACGKRVVLNYRGGEAARFFRFWGWAAGPILRLADEITIPSGFLAEIIGPRFGRSVSLVPNILDLSAFRYRQRASIEPKMLVARHLEKPYDIESVLRAFRVVQENYPQAELWLAGAGSEERRLRGLAARWKLANVNFLGAVSHGDLPALYDQCDIFVNASRIDNFPGALLEASAAGLVVVSTDAGGIPFVYEDGNTAFLVKTGDWHSLAVAVLKVLQNPYLAEQMATRAAAMARMCDWSEVRKHLYTAYAFPPYAA